MSPLVGSWALVGPRGSAHAGQRFQDTSISEQFADFADQFKTASVAGAVPWLSQWDDLGNWDPGTLGPKMKPAWLGLILNFLGKAVQSGKRMKGEG